MYILEKFVRQLLSPLESLFNRAFTENWNPWYQLGAIAFFMFWLATISGVYLYIFFDTSIFGAYASVEKITHAQWFAGGIMRSIHRYASDAMVITVTLHLCREFSLGRFRGARWFSWFSGIPLLWLLFAAAIGGYWLVWDTLSLYIAVTTSEWIDALPIFSSPLARNFLSAETLSDRFFSLLVFLHIALPLFLLLGMFIHIKRVSKAKTNPSRGLAIGMLSAILILALIKPAVSQGEVNLQYFSNQIRLDWFYLNLYPLIDQWSPAGVWLLIIGLSLCLAILPWLPSRSRDDKPAVVDPDNCNGCSWCFQDCPYEAITMVTHDYKKGHQQAYVDPELCTACGICAGSCPSATPFRSIDELITGIDMPDRPLDTILKECEDKIRRLTGDKKIIIFGCEHAAKIDSLENNETASVTLACIAQLPPSFVDYCLRDNKVNGVFVTGCKQDCFARKGTEWTEQRFNGTRMPHLRTRFAKEKVHIHWAGSQQLKALTQKIEQYRSTLNAEQ